MKKQFSTKRSIFVALMAAVIAVLSLVSIPMPSGVPITLQTFAIALCGYVLGWSGGGAAVGIYLALGAIGLPVFSGGNAGFSVFLGLTGGFLWGFVPLAMLCGLPFHNRFFRLLCGLAGIIVCHALGAVQYSLLTQNPLWAAVGLVSLPYLVKDALSVGGALLLACAIVPRIPALRQ